MKVTQLLAPALSLLCAVRAGELAVIDANSDALQQHIWLRNKLMATEQKERQDYAFRQNLSSVCQQADQIVRDIRQEEIDDYWRVPGSYENPDNERFAGEMFPRAREYISKTKLWKVVQNLPKGALLHAHLSAMLPYETILRTIIDTPGMVISANQSLATDLDREQATIVFAHVNHTIPNANPGITDAGYVPNTQILVTDVIASFPGGRGGFTDFIKNKTTIAPEESIRHELGVDEIWRKFQACFDPAGTMLTYEPVVRTFYKNLFSRLAQDKINWVEIRAGGSSGKLVHEGQEDPDPSLDVWWDVMLDEVNKFKKTELGKDFWGVRVIWSDPRGKSTASLIKSMGIALDRKEKYPDLFSGYDVIAQEDLGRSLLDLAPELLWLREQAQLRNLTVPFFFHAGETLGDWNATDLNLFDAVAFNTRRIGHGFSLYKHPELIDAVVEKSIMVEVCPISNEVLRLATDILHHPLPAMIAHGIPTAISNDDPAILGQDIAGVSYDFYQTIQAFESLGLAGLGALAQNSLRWSNFEDQEDWEWARDIDLGADGSGIKAQRIQQWNAQWEEFCQWTVDEYGN